MRRAARVACRGAAEALKGEQAAGIETGLDALEFQKLRAISPLPINRTKDSATSATTTTFRRKPALPRPVVRPLPRNTMAISGREARNAGTMPNRAAAVERGGEGESDHHRVDRDGVQARQSRRRQGASSRMPA